MKRISTIIVTIALIFGLSQCKKNVETINTVADGIQMTLVADNGAKTSFDGSGAISWGTNEKVYVVVDGYCRGHLTNGSGGGNTFTGIISGVSAGDHTFHYYYVGTEKEIADKATSFEMDFVDQDGTLANLGKFHVGYGSQEISYDGSSSISGIALMRSLVSIGYFDIAGMAEEGESVYMYGTNLNNKISIDFSTNEVTNGKIDAGTNNFICLGTVYSGSTCGRYVMLVPNHTDGTEELATDITFVSKRTTGTCNNTFRYGIIANRFYCKNGSTSTPIDVTETSYHPGTLRGVFTVASGTTVHFSQGNLQATTTNLGESWTWAFATNQYDYVGDYAGNNSINGSMTVSSNGTVDLFGWNGNTAEANNYGIYNSTTDSDYGNAAGEDLKSDWGNNTINNGTGSTWTTPTKNYWDYVLNKRTTSSLVRFAKARVNNVNGLILFPDDWNTSYYSITDANDGSKAYTTNEISLDNWNKHMEVNGCVFLPAAGYRSGTTIQCINGDACYKSSTSDPSNASYAFYLNFGSTVWNGLRSYNRYFGESVRLVTVVE